MTKKWFFYASAIALCVCIAFYACNKDEDDPDPPTPPDLDDPSLIAEDNLIAYFPFEGDGKCAITGITPGNATTPVTFPDGRRGKAFQGTAAANSGLLYTLPAGHKLRDLKAFSFAVWVKTAPNTVATTEAPEQMVFQVDGRDGDIWGNFAFLQKRNFPAKLTPADDFSEMMTFFFKEDAADWNGQFVGDWYIDATSTQWRHLICTYDNATSKFSAYVNGVHVTRYDGTPYTAADRTQGEDGPPFGALKFKGAANFAIGAWAEKLMGKALLEDEWAAPYRGQMDELRIYDKALTSAEAKQLYDKEALKIN